ncbi:MAG TPA: dephospho-CoA kinase [Steroidobacteraceae bacterium]|nr:dephospho-CoA kinase [Steroidobacteraceae bacterium]
MLRIGLTGGVASGKSTVAALFAGLGVTVIDTDRIAREIVEPGRPALAELVRALGTVILGSRGALDRAALRRRIFADADARRTVERILHPVILAELERKSREAGGPYQLLVVPLLVERNLAGLVDRVLVVDCDPESQIERLIKRDGETRESARAMLAAQAPREARLAAADDVIQNDGEPAALAASVATLDRRYREMAAQA